MSDLDDYLKQHYLNAEQFALLCGISVEKLDELIEAKLVPAPSYVVTTESAVRSAVFGEMSAPGSTPGAYFHPKNRTWVQQAIALEDARALKEDFIRTFASALTTFNKSTWRLSDSFTENGDPVPDGLEARTEAAWQHFLNGTFGLCVADPSSARAIAKKEILQEKLTSLTDNGATVPSDINRDELLALIDQYAAASMPFSPVEYSRSSRKRLVADLRQKLDAAS